MRYRIYLAGLAYMGLALWSIQRARLEPAGPVRPDPEPVTHVEAEPQPVVTGGTAESWFQQIKPFCNTLEVETALRQSPLPAHAGHAGAGYQAACLALAGRIDAARSVIAALSGSERWQAAGIVFNVAHPVADAGDDRSAGPIMALVVEFWPNHYVALYHAGASAFALGEKAAAKTHLEAFLVHYQAEDGWRSSARSMLERIGQ
ncbi:MAG: hypothetical protein FJ206_07005 [Gemmatimonadetes bacterium]|nr:hypothetical protein [Gemmatimonadota bacterium]